MDDHAHQTVRRVLVTGATGFIGRRVCAQLAHRGKTVRAAVRSSALASNGIETFHIGEIGPRTDWSAAVEGIEVVIHLAGRTHVPRAPAGEATSELWSVNDAGTERLSRQAVAAGVRRFVFASSIKVNGERTDATPFRASDPPAPADAYAISKCHAEARLHSVAEETGLEVVVVRPPMVYGPFVRGNFLRLLSAVARGVLLPLEAIKNIRSLLFVGNLADLLAVCAEHPAAAGQVLLVRDAIDLSTPDLIRAMARHLHRPSRLFSLPPNLLRAGGRILGQGEAVERLTESLVVDMTPTMELLNWRPPVAFEAAMEETASWFLGRQDGSRQDAYPDR